MKADAREEAAVRRSRGPARRHVSGLHQRRDGAAWYDHEQGHLVVLGKPVASRSEVPLLGDHNVANALFALLAVMVADPRPRDGRCALPPGRIASHVPGSAALIGARGRVRRRSLDQRLEGHERQLDARRARGMQQPTVLLLGGRHKGEPYTRLEPELRRTVKAVIAYGEAAPLIVQDIGAVVPTEQMARSFEEVIDRARSIAAPGRRRAALSRVLELRHVQELRGTRNDLQTARCRRGGHEVMTAVAQTRDRWRMGVEARALLLLTAVLLAFGLAVLYSASAMRRARTTLAARTI